jgi:hypothetical protein
MPTVVVGGAVSMCGRIGLRRISLVAMVLVLSGCMGRYALDRRPVKHISEAERRSRGRVAYDRARDRVAGIQQGMSSAQVQATLGAVIAVEETEAGEGGQKKLMDGFVCKLNPTPVTERWLFGYDEGNVLLVGFAIEFVRSNADDNDWTVKRIDRSPADDCPVVGDTHLD